MPPSEHAMNRSRCFSGSNCDHDAFYDIGNVLPQAALNYRHQSQDLANVTQLSQGD